MVKPLSKIIILTAVVMMTSMILLFSSTTLNGYSQGLEIPEFKPKAPENIEVPEIQSNIDSTETKKTPSEEIAMKVQLEEHTNEFLADDDFYEVSDFAFVASNSSKLCPAGNCEYELEGGEMLKAYTAGERSLTGKFKVDTGESKKLMDMRASWETVEERETADGELVRVIEGDLAIGRDVFSPEHEYRINGTLTTDGDDYLLAIKGTKHTNHPL
jgi:hypothetical protein